MKQDTTQPAPRPGKSLELKPRDISDEVSRSYHFASGRVYTIHAPIALYASKIASTHRVVDSTGVVHCVAFPGPAGDTVLTWEPRHSDRPVAF